jgi:enamine deaminase RidA (YjgF/YER057c/UK114 family)
MKKTIVVVVTNLSNRYEVAEIDPAHDRISSQKDDEWNRKILEMLGEGRLEDVAQVARDFAREANADMGFKAIWWLGAVMGEHNKYDGKVWDYQPVWGTGNAIVELAPNERKQIDWEKEFDEGPVPTFASTAPSGTGLETHNVSRSHRRGRRHPHGEGAEARRPTARGASADVVPLRHRSAQTGNGEVPGLRPDAATTSRSRRAAIENVKTILEEAGSSLEKVVDVAAPHRHARRLRALQQGLREYFRMIQPTRTTVGVDSLPTPIAVELKASQRMSGIRALSRKDGEGPRD